MIAEQASDVVPVTDGTEDPQSHKQDSKVGNATKVLKLEIAAIVILLSLRSHDLFF